MAPQQTPRPLARRRPPPWKCWGALHMPPLSAIARRAVVPPPPGGLVYAAPILHFRRPHAVCTQSTTTRVETPPVSPIYKGRLLAVVPFTTSTNTGLLEVFTPGVPIPGAAPRQCNDLAILHNPWFDIPPFEPHARYKRRGLSMGLAACALACRKHTAKPNNRHFWATCRKWWRTLCDAYSIPTPRVPFEAGFALLSAIVSPPRLPGALCTTRASRNAFFAFWCFFGLLGLSSVGLQVTCALP